ncbi:NAD(FAD)-utilizing dehydrogenase [Tardiphaga robiniae]|uniref:NAD(FAD)-utilizing dehydrogenase n=2 Tax=Tardiphaga robiniae TaxID=943830 RepID=A0A164AIV6_9BRAD|nr:TIGR03862 family flavoprotein [Tardiphaga robiniae]KZD24880.1 NAD(FAD)-utilizing dehydrogenase [Tardiphaga robiniae]
MAAEALSRGGAAVTVYDAMPSAGRKFLMAGRGGLNLTHSEPLPEFLKRYGAVEARLALSISAFTPTALRDWSEALGQPTFVGSSGRVFPQAFKASPLLRAWLRRLDESGVRFAFRHRWTGWDGEGRLIFQTPNGAQAIACKSAVLALGGASWPRLGSDGAWVDVLAAKGVRIAPLRPANSGFTVAWSEIFKDRFEGQPLKGVALSFAAHSVRSEAMVTRAGIEGGIYALSSVLREAVIADGKATLKIALRPDLDAGELTTKLAASRGKQSFSNFLRKTIHLSPVAIGLLQEVTVAEGIQLASLSPERLASLINAVPVTLNGVAPIARAISTAGGISFDEVDDAFMLKRLPGTFVAGEMLDWEAPTGGYLLQASFATGAAAGEGALHWLSR